MIQHDLIALSGKYIQKAILNEIHAGSKLIPIAQSKRHSWHLLNVNMAQVENNWLH